MKLRLVAGISILFLSVGLLLSAFLLGPDLLIKSGVGQNDLSQQELSPDKYNPIIRENAHQGTTTWRIPPGKEATTQIQAYANATSVAIEHKITFYVSTQQEGTPYFVGIYRLGWYSGLGGRLMAPLVKELGHAQGYYDSTVQPHLIKQRLVGCTTCFIDKKTGLVEANWKPSYNLYIPDDWTTGVYLAKFIDINGWQTYTPFDVLSNFHAVAVIVTPDTTYQAYNIWGGYSLYGVASNIAASNSSEADASGPAVDSNGLTRALKVSFDRPYIQEAGSSLVLSTEADAIDWLESRGYDMTYISNVDLQTHPEQLLLHRTYVSLGHDEYWTKEMRDGVEKARDSGVGLAFLGAGASYWQMRFEPDSHGVPNRTVVCYKVRSGVDLSRDPFYGKDNSRVTALWRDPIIGRPENALIGIMFSGETTSTTLSGFPWMLNPKVKSPFLSGTGLQQNRSYGCTLVGYEWDRVFNNGASPAGLTVLGSSQTENTFGQPDVSNTTYYVAKSGALVFATGSIDWTQALDDYRLHFNPACGHQIDVVPQMQLLLANILRAIDVHHTPGQPLSAATLTGARLPVFPTFDSLPQSLIYGTSGGRYLFTVCIALLCISAYVLLGSEENLRRFCIGYYRQDREE